ILFLTSLDILDTGYLTVNSRTGQLTAATYRVNSGVALRLKGVDLTVESSSNLDKAVTPAFFPATIKAHEKRALISVNPTRVTLKVFLSSLNADTSGYYGVNDIALLPLLMRLPHTYGFKAVYYPVDNAAVDTGGNTSNKRNLQLVYNLGATDTTEAQGDLATGGDKVVL